MNYSHSDTTDKPSGHTTADEENSDRVSNAEVLIIGPFQRGGIHSYIKEQTQRLDGRISVTVHDSGAPPMEETRTKFLRGVYSGILAFVQYIRLTPPDIVHIHTSHRYSFYRKSLYVLFAKFVWDVPVILHIHGSSFDDFIETASPLLVAYQSRVFRASNEIIVLSEYWKDVLATRAEKSKIRVLPNAVDPTMYPADPTDDIPHIVFISNLIERKGVREFAAAIEGLSKRQVGDFLVTIAGDGPLSRHIERLSDQHEEVTYLGYVSEEEKRKVLCDGSIYVLPTYAEGLPIAMLEGMAGANAIISTSVGSIPEVIGPERGILIEPGDVDSLVDALKELVTSPERRALMAENNRRVIEECYSWHRITEELIEIYDTYT